MDGCGRYLDNIFIERLWRSLKYEAAYLRELAGGPAAEREISDWFELYNHARADERRDRSIGTSWRKPREAAARPCAPVATLPARKADIDGTVQQA